MSAQQHLVSSFTRGLDLRPLVVDSRVDSLAIAENVFLEGPGFIKRRPCLRDPGFTGSLDANSQGLLGIGSSLFTFARKGASATVPSGVTLREFDLPQNCGNDWQLLDCIAFDGYPCALIRHASSTHGSEVWLHVWDSRTGVYLPSYVEDLLAPSSWRKPGPSLPDPEQHDGSTAHNNGPRYRLSVAGNRLCCSDSEGDVRFSRVANARVWNLRDQEQILDDGRIWEFRMAAGQTNMSYVVPLVYAETDGFLSTFKYAAVSVEQLTDNGWQALDQTTTASVLLNNEWKLITTTSRLTGLATETTVSLQVPAVAADTLFRFRVLTAHPVRVVSGCAVTETGGVVSLAAGQVDVVGFTSNVAEAKASGSRALQTARLDVAAGSDYTLQTNKRSYHSIAITINTTTGALRAAWSTFDEGVATARTYQHDTTPIGLMVRIYETDGVAAISNDIDRLSVYPNVALNQVYNMEVERALGFSGANAAGFLPTSARSLDDATVSVMGGVEDRLMVGYPLSLQVWELGILPASDRLLTNLGFGSEAGNNEAVALANDILFDSPRGLRSVSLRGDDLSSAQETGVGEPIESLAITMKAAVWWPSLGCYVAAADIDGSLEFLCFSWRPGDQIAGWSRWSSSSMTDVDRRGLAVVGNQLYARNGTTLLAFDGSFANDLIDDGETTGSAYLSRVRTHFVPIAGESNDAQLRSVDVLHRGSCTMRVSYTPYAPDSNQYEFTFGSVLASVTLGKVPIRGVGSQVAVTIESRDEASGAAAFAAHRFSIWYRPVRQRRSAWVGRLTQAQYADMPLVMAERDLAAQITSDLDGLTTDNGHPVLGPFGTADGCAQTPWQPGGFYLFTGMVNGTSYAVQPAGANVGAPTLGSGTSTPTGQWQWGRTRGFSYSKNSELSAGAVDTRLRMSMFAPEAMTVVLFGRPFIGWSDGGWVNAQDVCSHWRDSSFIERFSMSMTAEGGRYDTLLTVEQGSLVFMIQQFPFGSSVDVEFYAYGQNASGTWGMTPSLGGLSGQNSSLAWGLPGCTRGLRIGCSNNGDGFRRITPGCELSESGGWRGWFYLPSTDLTLVQSICRQIKTKLNSVGLDLDPT